MEMFTLDQVGAKLLVSKDTIKRAIAKGHMEAYKVGSQWRVSREQIDNYLIKRTVSRLRRQPLKLK